MHKENPEGQGHDKDDKDAQGHDKEDKAHDKEGKEEHHNKTEASEGHHNTTEARAQGLGLGEPLPLAFSKYLQVAISIPSMTCLPVQQLKRLKCIIAV